MPPQMPLDLADIPPKCAYWLASTDQQVLSAQGIYSILFIRVVIQVNEILSWREDCESTNRLDAVFLASMRSGNKQRLEDVHPFVFDVEEPQTVEL